MKDFWNSKARKFATLFGKIYLFITPIFFFLCIHATLYSTPNFFPTTISGWLLLPFGFFIYMILPGLYPIFLIYCFAHLISKENAVQVEKTKKTTMDIIYYVFFFVFPFLIFGLFAWLDYKY